MTTINDDMASLQTAATAAIADFADVTVRGYLKEHPDLVVHRLDLLASMIERVRIAVIRDRAASPCPPHPCVAAEHAEMVAEYTEHTCDCDFCLCGS
ncbi:hypothetical protein ACFU76_07965 [Streptomyces sp. NPDC057539]|uniref:hypothetical protein n=1 Tax=Streptomyces sp. NPDC057539 TaxID=3346159 RepID=UPI0036C04A8D